MFRYKDFREIGYELALTVNSVLILFILKLSFFIVVRNQINILYLISFFHDSSLLILNYIFCVYFLKKLPKCETAGRILFYVLLIILIAVSAAYTYFIPDLINFPINLFSVSVEHIIFLKDFLLNPKVYILSIAGIAGIFSLTLIFPKRKWGKTLIISSTVIFIIFLLTLPKPSINPIVYSVIEESKVYLSGKSEVNKLIEPAVDGSKSEYKGVLEKHMDDNSLIFSKFKRIIVFVMEGIPISIYMKGAGDNRNQFMQKYSDNITEYTNYYTLNVDSYTSLLTMLTGVFIPYQAYTDETRYDFVNRRINLVRILNSSGYRTSFVTSYGKQQERFVPCREEWNRTVYSEDTYADPSLTRVNSNRIENAYEDLAVFGELIKSVSDTGKSFVLQELVYGHTAEWELKTGIKVMDYYNSYFQRTIDTLAMLGLLEGTLIVITSDHGLRDDVYNPQNYHLPFLLYSNSSSGKKCDEFVSHLDFQEIILNYLQQKEVSLKNEFIFTVGNSGELVYGTIDYKDRYTFINNRTGKYESNTSKDEVMKLAERFQDYLNYFESIRQKGNNNYKNK